MGYLVCDKCEGYYELQEGENPEDFESCECSGKLKFTENIGIALESSQKQIYCPKCGKNNIINAIYCENCGKKFKFEKEEKKDVSKGKTKKLIKSVVYTAFGFIVLIILLYNIGDLFDSPIYISLIFLAVLVAVFLFLRYLLGRFLG